MLNTYIRLVCKTCPWSDASTIRQKLYLFLFTHSMEQSPSWETNRFSASQAIMRILWNPEGSLPHSQVPATCPYPQPARSRPHPHNALNIPSIKSHVPFPLLRPYQSISPGPKLYVWTFGNKITFLRWGVVSTSPNPQDGGPPIFGCPRRLIQYIHSYPPYWRPFLHPQPEDAPCRGHADPLTASVTMSNLIKFHTLKKETEPSG
jgi:hypothetical protein